MRISRRKPKYKNQYKIRIKYRTNQFIKVPEVRLVDENGENLGVVPTEKALTMAREKELDLVEVSPLAKPPVAKILDFNKLKYQEGKEQRKEKAKQKKVEVKGIRLSLRIGKHDTETKLHQAEKFLSENDKVKIELFLRGRERQHRSLAKEIINNFLESLDQITPIKIEQELNVQGGRLTVVVNKK